MSPSIKVTIETWCVTCFPTAPTPGALSVMLPSFNTRPCSPEHHWEHIISNHTQDAWTISSWEPVDGWCYSFCRLHRYLVQLVIKRLWCFLFLFRKMREMVIQQRQRECNLLLHCILFTLSGVCVHACMHVEIRGLRCGFKGLNSVCQSFFCEYIFSLSHLADPAFTFLWTTHFSFALGATWHLLGYGFW